MNHETVILAGVVIPLIGIPASATEELCAHCHDYFHLQSIYLTDDQGFLCEKCRTNYLNHDETN